MKTKTLLIVFLMMSVYSANAQSEASSYLNKVMELLETGDCESAQRFYNVYKELTGKQTASLQVLIDDCKAVNKTYTLGEHLDGNSSYHVAFLDSSKKHGLAIYEARDETSYLSPYDMYSNYDHGHLITLEELNKIIPNKNYIQISGDYWTSTVSKPSRDSDNIRYYVKNIETGIVKSVRCHSDKKYKLLYVIEF